MTKQLNLHKETTEKLLKVKKHLQSTTNFYVGWDSVMLHLIDLYWQDDDEICIDE